MVGGRTCGAIGRVTSGMVILIENFIALHEQLLTHTMPMYTARRRQLHLDLSSPFNYLDLLHSSNRMHFPLTLAPEFHQKCSTTAFNVLYHKHGTTPDVG